MLQQKNLRSDVEVNQPSKIKAKRTFTKNKNKKPDTLCMVNGHLFFRFIWVHRIARCSFLLVCKGHMRAFVSVSCAHQNRELAFRHC